MARHSTPCATVLVVVLFWAASLRATPDDAGAWAELLGVFGKGERYALIAERCIADECMGQIASHYILDLRDHGGARRIGAKPSGWGASSNDADYIRDLPPRWAKLVKEHFVAAERLERATSEDVDGGRVRFRFADGRSVFAAVQRMGRFPSMAAYDRVSGRRCWPRPMCSNCRQTRVIVSGLAHQVIQCSATAGTWKTESGAAACRCRGIGERYQLQVFGPKRGTRQPRLAFGTEVLALPYSLVPIPTEPKRDPLRISMLLSARAEFLSAYQTAAGRVIVVGSIVYMPSVRGAHSAVAAAVPAPQ